MIGALFRLVFRGIALILLLGCALGAYHLYRSGRLPLIEKALSETALVGSVTTALAIHRDLSRRDLSVSVEGGTVRLRGVVASDAESRAAEELASNVEGVEHVVNDLDVSPDVAETQAGAGADGSDSRTLGETLDDVALLAKVRAALHLDREARKLEVDVSVASGTVALSGTVPSEALLDRVVARVESVGGVLEVEADGLRVASVP